MEIARKNYLILKRAYHCDLEKVAKKREMLIKQQNAHDKKFCDEDAGMVDKRLKTMELMLRKLDEEETTIKNQFDIIDRAFNRLKPLKSCWNIE